jgi:hypothetical protein
MKQFVRLGTAMACGLVVVGALLAQTRTDTRTVASTTTIQRGTVVMGANVVLQDGTTVGRVEDFVISSGGCIDFVVVSFESKFVLVPWTVATWSRDRTIRVNITRERFREVPTFSRDQWTTVQDAQFIQKVRSAWGVSESRFGEGRQPLDRRDTSDQRRDDRTNPPDRRDDRTNPPDRRDTRDQRKDVENPNRPPTTNPPERRDTSKDKDRDRPKPPDRPPPPPPERPPQ